MRKGYAGAEERQDVQVSRDPPVVASQLLGSVDWQNVQEAEGFYSGGEAVLRTEAGF